MSDTDPTAVIQPGADNSDTGGALSAPTAPVTPTVPEVPVVPEAKDGKMTELEQAESEEWDTAADELFPGLKKNIDNKEDKKPNEPAKPEKTPEEIAADKAAAEAKTPPIDPNETPEQKTAREAKEAADAAAKTDEKDEPTEPDGAAARLAAREEAAAVEAVKTDIRTKMFANVPTELRDSDGDLIKSVNDVVKLINPNTGQPFTAEEAGTWLTLAQNQLKENVANVENLVNQITNVNLDLKDQADMVNYNYGELLRAMPDLRKSLWDQFEKTMAKDTRTGIITKAPVSLEKFYAAALEPYAQLGRQLEIQEVDKVKTVEADKKAADDKAAAEAASKQQRRSDRSDIYGAGKVDTATEDDKEWAAAAEAVFGPIK